MDKNDRYDWKENCESKVPHYFKCGLNKIMKKENHKKKRKKEKSIHMNLSELKLYKCLFQYVLILKNLLIHGQVVEETFGVK